MRRISFERSWAGSLTLCGVLAAASALGSASLHAQNRDRDRGPDHDRGAQHFDPAREHFDRFNHAHFYPNRGSFVRVLPAQHYDVAFRGSHYFFAGGVWYAPGAGGWLVVAPPFGLFAPVLPPFYTTVWVAGSPYYYADDVYYVYRGPALGYEVVAPPPGQEVADAGPGSPPGPPPGPPPGSDHQLFIYPRNGQTPDQQARDRYECHSWASSQTGFDPTAPNGGVPPPQTANAHADYDRAMAACLEGRGYTVK
jgi:hypothetical protein